MLKVCTICGAEYEAHADYCNVCKQHSLTPVASIDAPQAEREPLSADHVGLAAGGALWLLGMGYFLVNHRPRGLLDLGLAWSLLTGISLIGGLAAGNVRLGAFFSAVGLGFMALYFVIKML